MGPFRRAMAWLHTWAGVVIGSVLFAIFWMGTLTVFDQEFDRWMQPGTRIAAPAAPVSLDRTVLPAVTALADGNLQWGVRFPDERTAHLRLFARKADGEFVTRAVDGTTGTLIAEQGSLAGTGFFFPFHFHLHIDWLGLGYWLVGLAGMAMLVLLVSGVIIHKKIFADFFLFRPKKYLQRASLDLHNLTGVLGLPFHFLITLSGLIIFVQIYFPQAYEGAYGTGKQAQAAFQIEAIGRYTRPRLEQPGQLASLDAMVAEAERLWPGGKATFVRVWHPGDAGAYVEVRRSYAHEVTMNLDQLYFDGQTGALLYRFEARPVVGVHRFISGMHFIQFNHWGLRWLYFLAGLSGCVMIATGFLFWLESRRASHAKKGLSGVRVVEALTVGSVSGIVLATMAYLVVNRLLPLDTHFAGQARAELEVWVFYLVWLGTFFHAAWRRAEAPGQPARRAWSEQCWAIAALALLAVVLNAVTTGDHLVRTLMRGDWQVAGLDLMLLLGAALAAWAAVRIKQVRQNKPGTRAKAAAANKTEGARG
ncbi:iron uptake protein [Oxalicibacterium flavum]|uniref:Iron uptake protein n=2 Tax=Oxalicibacterium flavum TaxID=179467 RepID=A0A8J2ULE0_9BURK|nr:iron uptake protein [Oxalicibacterium flavum]